MTKRIAVLQIRLAPEELEQVRNDAQAQGYAVSEYIRRALLQKPEEMIAKGSTTKELPNAGDVRPDAGRERVSNPVATRLREEIPELTVAAELPTRSVLERLPLVGEQHVAKPGAKTCKHGTQKGYRCWQCGGIANVNE